METEKRNLQNTTIATQAPVYGSRHGFPLHQRSWVQLFNCVVLTLGFHPSHDSPLYISMLKSVKYRSCPVTHTHL